MSTNQTKTTFTAPSSNYPRSLEPASTANTKFTIRITVNPADCMKNFLHNRGVTATNLNTNSIYFASLTPN
jgi:hypothetical protein